jgi:prophage antirepressor-like protein
MKTELIPFDFNGQSVRVVNRDGEPWFVAPDVCAVLEHTNPTKALQRLDEDEKALTTIQGISRGNDNVNIINESGLFALVLTSRKPEAKRFRKWVTAEVLPSLRKTGHYGNNELQAENARLRRQLAELQAVSFSPIPVLALYFEDVLIHGFWWNQQPLTLAQDLATLWLKDTGKTLPGYEYTSRAQFMAVQAGLETGAHKIVLRPQSLAKAVKAPVTGVFKALEITPKTTMFTALTPAGVAHLREDLPRFTAWWWLEFLPALLLKPRLTGLPVGGEA